MKMSGWNEKRVETCLLKLSGFLRLENHIIRSYPKNPKKGTDVADRFKKDVFPEIVSDVVDSISAKILCGDAVDENVVIREITHRLNTELVRLGVAMMPYMSQ